MCFRWLELSLLKSIVLLKFNIMDVVCHMIINNQIQRLFNSAMRFTCNLEYNEHVTPSIFKPNLEPLRREMHALFMIL